jgi:predicted aspartyl protease
MQMATRLLDIGRCLTALALACGMAQAAQASTKVDMQDCSGLPCVNLNIDGKLVELMIDTGDAASVLDRSEAKVLGLTVEPYKGDDGKEVPGYFVAKAANPQLGKATLAPITFLVMDIQKSLANGTFPRSYGTISYVALKDRVVTLDYRKHKVEISDPGVKADAPKNAGEITYPTFGHHGPPIVAVTGFAVNGKPVTVQVDTLYAGTMLIYTDSISKLGLQAPEATAVSRRFPYTDGGVDMLQAKADSELFSGESLLKDAPLYFPTPKVHQPDGMFDGTVGGELFKGRRVTFDFPANQFWLD